MFLKSRTQLRMTMPRSTPVFTHNRNFSENFTLTSVSPVSQSCPCASGECHLLDIEYDFEFLAFITAFHVLKVSSQGSTFCYLLHIICKYVKGAPVPINLNGTDTISKLVSPSVPFSATIILIIICILGQPTNELVPSEMQFSSLESRL